MASPLRDPSGGLYAHADGLVGREIAGETILVPVRGDLATLQRSFVMNPVAAHVWRRLDGKTSLGAILDEVLERFEVGAEQARADLEEFVADLHRSELVAEVPDPEGESLRRA